MTKYRRKVSRITPKLYAEIKSKLHEPSDDEDVMREYKIGKMTTRTIRNSENYEVYCEKVQHKITPEEAEKKLDNIVKNAKYDRKETTEETPKMPKIGIAVVERHEEKSNAFAQIVGVFLVVCLLLIVGGITLGVLRWALKF